MKNNKSGGKNLKAAAVASVELREVARLTRLKSEVARGVAGHGARPALEAVAGFERAAVGYAYAWRERQDGRGSVNIEGHSIRWSRAASVQSDVASVWRAAAAAAFVRGGYTLPDYTTIAPRKGLERAAAAAIGADCMACLQRVGGRAPRYALRAARAGVWGGGVLPSGAAVLPFGDWLEWRRAGNRARLEARRLLWAGGEEKEAFASVEALEAARAVMARGQDESERGRGAVELRAEAADSVALHWGRRDSFRAPAALGRRVSWAGWCLVAFWVYSDSRKWRGALSADRARLAAAAKIARGAGVEALEKLGLALGVDDSGAVRDCRSVETMRNNLRARIAGGDVLLTNEPDLILSLMLEKFGPVDGLRAVRAFDSCNDRSEDSGRREELREAIAEAKGGARREIGGGGRDGWRGGVVSVEIGTAARVATLKREIASGRGYAAELLQGVAARDAKRAGAAMAAGARIQAAAAVELDARRARAILEAWEDEAAAVAGAAGDYAAEYLDCFAGEDSCGFLTAGGRWIVGGAWRAAAVELDARRARAAALVAAGRVPAWKEGKAGKGARRAK